MPFYSSPSTIQYLNSLKYIQIITCYNVQIIYQNKCRVIKAKISISGHLFCYEILLKVSW